jgi:hypothetical protein
MNAATPVQARNAPLKRTEVIAGGLVVETRSGTAGRIVNAIPMRCQAIQGSKTYARPFKLIALASNTLRIGSEKCSCATARQDIARTLADMIVQPLATRWASCLTVYRLDPTDAGLSGRGLPGGLGGLGDIKLPTPCSNHPAIEQ